MFFSPRKSSHYILYASPNRILSFSAQLPLLLLFFRCLLFLLCPRWSDRFKSYPIIKSVTAIVWRSHRFFSVYDPRVPDPTRNVFSTKFIQPFSLCSFDYQYRSLSSFHIPSMMTFKAGRNEHCNGVETVHVEIG